jgi:hypothetical protein
MAFAKFQLQTNVFRKDATIFLLSVLLFIFIAIPACNRGTGCPINENVHVQPNKKGQYPVSKTRSGLFPKDMKKKTKVN